MDDDYPTVTVADLPDAPSNCTHKKEIDEAVGATAFGCNYYEAAPGEPVPWGRHYHPDHEELFYVVEGRLRVETPDGDRFVESGQAMFVPPGAPQKAVGAGDGPTRLLAVGAPKDSDGAVIEEECPACGEVTGREYEARDGGETYVLFCDECGAEVDRLTA